MAADEARNAEARGQGEVPRAQAFATRWGKAHKPGRTYTLEERAHALAVLKAKGGNLRGTARDLGMPVKTLRDWRDGVLKRGDDPVPEALKRRAEKDLAGAIDRIRWRYLRRAAEANAIRTTSGYYAVQTAHKLTEMFQLLTGGPTARVELNAWGQLLQEIRGMRAARVAPEPALPEPPVLEGQLVA